MTDKEMVLRNLDWFHDRIDSCCEPRIPRGDHAGGSLRERIRTIN